MEKRLEVADQWAVMDLARGMAWRDGMIMWFMTFFFKMVCLSETRSGELESSRMPLRDKPCDHGYWLGYQMKKDGAMYDGLVWLQTEGSHREYVCVLRWQLWRSGNSLP